ncbi:MAG: RNA polymerase sigma factor [Blastocatellia bacterium]
MLKQLEHGSEPDDEALWRMMMRGDEEAFVSLYRRRQAGVYRFALRMSGSESVAEDVTQEVFIALMRNPNLFQPGRASLATYLFGIARNQVLRHAQRNRTWVEIGADDVEEAAGELTANSDPLLDLARSETVGIVRQAIGSLPGHYREVVVLCELHEVNYTEAAEIIGCPVGTVRSRLNRARALLVDKLRAAGASLNEGKTEPKQQAARPRGGLVSHHADLPAGQEAEAIGESVTASLPEMSRGVILPAGLRI